MYKHVIALDPFCEIDKIEVKKSIDEKQTVENYVFELHKPGECNEQQFDRCVEERKYRVILQKHAVENNKRLGHLKDYKNHLEEINNQLREKKDLAGQEMLKWLEHAEKLKFNFEVIVYMRQGQVEIIQQPVTTDYKDSILIEKKVIDEENGKI